MELEGAEGLEPEGLLEGKELAQDGGSLSDSSDDEEDGEGGSLGDGSGAEGGSCSSSRRSGGDGGDEAEGSSVGAGEGESVRHFPLARPKSLLQKLHVSFQGSWLKEFPWLYYCQETGLMSCAWCTAAAAAAAPPELILAGGPVPGGHDELCKGTRNYKRALLLRHHLSAEHRLNEPGSAEQVGGGPPSLPFERFFFPCGFCFVFFPLPFAHVRCAPSHGSVRRPRRGGPASPAAFISRRKSGDAGGSCVCTALFLH